MTMAKLLRSVLSQSQGQTCLSRKGSSRSISSSKLEIQRTTNGNPKPKPEELRFGHVFTDHMLTIKYFDNKWDTPRIVPFQNLNVSPAISGLQYGLQCFEGMKGYKCADKTLRLFRPDKNMARLTRSMERLQMPGHDFDNDELQKCIAELVRLDQDWIPNIPNSSLYLRPTVISTHPYLGLESPEHLLLYVIGCPVGPYYRNGFQAVHLTADTEYVRAWPGGTGSHKVGGNYAATIKAQHENKRFDQILWLRDNYVTEVGSMNVFFVINNVLVTPPLDHGDILPGVTRDSILHLAKDWMEVDERYPTIQEIAEASKNGTLTEAFGAGTAAVVTPIASITHNKTRLGIPNTGPVTKQVWDLITGIQYGKIPGPEGWSVVL